MVAIGAIIIYFHAPHGATNYEVPYLRADWKKFFGILLESFSAERAGYSGDVLSANLNWVHYPENSKRSGTNGTASDKLIRHEVLPPRLAVDATSRTAAASEAVAVRCSGFPPCLKKISEEVGGNCQPWLKGFPVLRLLLLMRDAGLRTSTTPLCGTGQHISRLIGLR